MRLPRSTLVLIFLAVSLGSFVYFYEIKNKTAQQQVKSQKSKMFTFAADDVQSLTIKTKDMTLQLARRNSNNISDKKPQWEIKSPVSALANDGVVSYLMDLLVDGRIEKTTSILPSQLSEFGLDKPLATIDVTLKNQQSHQLILGKSDFNNEFIYAKVYPSQNRDLLLISKNFANAVNRNLSEWQLSGQNQLDNKSQSLPSLPSLPPITATPSSVVSPTISPTSSTTSASSQTTSQTMSTPPKNTPKNVSNSSKKTSKTTLNPPENTSVTTPNNTENTSNVPPK